MALRRRSACLTRLLRAAACGGNPVLGTWETDRDANDRGEHRVEVLEDGRIRVELPIGATAA